MNPNESPQRSWDRLTGLARRAPVPEVDVSLQVLRSLSRPPRELQLSVFETLSGMTSSFWVRGGLTALALVTGFLGYRGLESSDALLLVLGFSL